MEIEGFFLCSQKPITGLYPQSNYSWQSWSKLDTNCSPILYSQRYNTVHRNILLEGRFIVHFILFNMHYTKKWFWCIYLEDIFCSKTNGLYINHLFIKLNFIMYSIITVHEYGQKCNLHLWETSKPHQIFVQ
jgi:hypothetical protein